MSALVSISTPRESADIDAAAHQIRTMPVVVISPHNQCNCRCVMCDIWRIREPQEIKPADLERQLVSFRQLGARWVVFTGGEPQLNDQLGAMALMLRAEGIRVTMLTAGLLLERHAESIAATIDDVIVSLDGPPAVHNRIRRVPGAFEQLAAGIKALRQIRPEIAVRGRCTVQKANHNSIRAVVQSAKEIGLNSISFLAADLTSAAFNRPQGWQPDRQERVALNVDEIEALEAELERLIREHSLDLDYGFVVESAGKLRRLALHFRAHLGLAPHIAPRCNAPWVSAVIEASGDVRPCFFHPALGNIHRQTLHHIVNSPEAVQFRANLDIAANPVCRRCVCSLHIQPQEQ
ncbi:MAG TPA: radical SAM protein [Terriglobales bacterium]|nr:radical SAM protein [Terriglobales bacterium]